MNRQVLPKARPEIHPRRAFYIKLGRDNEWAGECIRNGTLRVGFGNIDNSLGSSGRWDEVYRAILNDGYGWTKGTARRKANELRRFYEASSEDLWITFYANLLWWCFARSGVEVIEDGHKIRHTMNGWKQADIYGRPLQVNRLSGKLLSVKMYQGTICRVHELSYVTAKINGQETDEVRAARQALEELEARAAEIIKGLYWGDFEILVDMIFRQAGWQRVSVLGELQETLDLDLISPVTQERYGVQVKSQADRSTFDGWLTKVADLDGYRRFYFVVHSPKESLTQHDSTKHSQLDVKLLLPEDLSRLAVGYGLVEWLLERAG